MNVAKWIFFIVTVLVAGCSADAAGPFNPSPRDSVTPEGAILVTPPPSSQDGGTVAQDPTEAPDAGMVTEADAESGPDPINVDAGTSEPDAGDLTDAAIDASPVCTRTPWRVACAHSCTREGDGCGSTYDCSIPPTCEQLDQACYFLGHCAAYQSPISCITNPGGTCNADAGAFPDGGHG